MILIRSAAESAEEERLETPSRCRKTDVSNRIRTMRRRGALFFFRIFSSLYISRRRKQPSPPLFAVRAVFVISRDSRVLPNYILIAHHTRAAAKSKRSSGDRTTDPVNFPRIIPAALSESRTKPRCCVWRAVWDTRDFPRSSPCPFVCVAHACAYHTRAVE